MGKLGEGLHTTEGGDRIFVGPGVQRYEREDGGEVIIVEPTDPDSAADNGDEPADD